MKLFVVRMKDGSEHELKAEKFLLYEGLVMFVLEEQNVFVGAFVISNIVGWWTK